MNKSMLRLSEIDDVAVATVDLERGAHALGVEALQRIPAGHKLALRDLRQGDFVRKYAHVIGRATADIRRGEHVHTHNLSADGVESDGQAKSLDPFVLNAGPLPTTFNGFLRRDGRVGTRNYVGILTTVNCSASVARAIARALEGEAAALAPQIDGVVALGHGSGCALGGNGLGIKLLQRTLRGYLDHPNFAAVLVIGLGCETNQLTGFTHDVDLSRCKMLEIQKEGGTAAAVKRGIKIVRGLMLAAATAVRASAPISHLCIGLQCGGSDGLSGITANPALGIACDLMVAAGGTCILSETPEVYGAEGLLIDRAVNTTVADALRARLAWWQRHAQAHGGSMDDNPSHGNKTGGLTTILEKSLGAIAKAGHSPLVHVYDYAERITHHGFVFMDSPGYDPTSATGQIASGANLLAFTTGRGSVFGSIPAPCLKIATNSTLFNHMQGDMDLNAGTIAEGLETVEVVGRRLFNALIDMANGKQSKSEGLGIGEAEFVPWVPDAVM